MKEIVVGDIVMDGPRTGVILEKKDEWVTVRWPGGETEDYRVGQITVPEDVE